MKTNNVSINFELTLKEQIRIDLGSSLSEVDPCNDVKIIFHGNDLFVLSDDCFLYVMREFMRMLQASLENKLQLHSSITKDIGYLYNQELHGDEGFVYTQEEGQSFWVARRNTLWDSSAYSTWLYNDNDGNIILEVTPNYPWHFNDSVKDENYVEYDVFMKNYKPTAIRTIPRSIVQIWLKQVKDILKVIDVNCG